MFSTSVYLHSVDLEALMTSLKIGPNVDDGRHDHDHGHEHHQHENDHDGHNHDDLHRRKRSIHLRHEGHEENITFNQVPESHNSDVFYTHVN